LKTVVRSTAINFVFLMMEGKTDSDDNIIT